MCSCIIIILNIASGSGDVGGGSSNCSGVVGGGQSIFTFFTYLYL